MRIVISIWHPAHVHFFRNIIAELEKQGHQILVVTRKKEHTIELLDYYGISYEVVGQHEKKNLLRKLTNMIIIIREMKKISKRFNPDILLGVNDTYSPFLGKLVNRPSVVFSDDDIWMLNSFIVILFSSYLVTPKNFRIRVRKNHIKYNGFHELAYLHSEVFVNKNSIEKHLEIEDKEVFILFRFVGWNASHDIGQSGINLKLVEKYINIFRRFGKIFISSEKQLPNKLKKYALKLEPGLFHDLLASASLLITDSQTTATEAAVVGTPVIRTNSFVGQKEMSNFIVLGKKFRLVYNISDPESALKLGLVLMKYSKNIKEKHLQRKEKLMKEKINVTPFAVDFINTFESGSPK